MHHTFGRRAACARLARAGRGRRVGGVEQNEDAHPSRGHERPEEQRPAPGVEKAVEGHGDRVGGRDAQRVYGGVDRVDQPAPGGREPLRDQDALRPAAQPVTDPAERAPHEDERVASAKEGKKAVEREAADRDRHRAAGAQPVDDPAPDEEGDPHQDGDNKEQLPALPVPDAHIVHDDGHQGGRREPELVSQKAGAREEQQQAGLPPREEPGAELIQWRFPLLTKWRRAVSRPPPSPAAVN